MDIDGLENQPSHILWVEQNSYCISGFELWGVAIGVLEGAKEKMPAVSILRKTI